MTREQLIELRWLLKNWGEENKNEGTIYRGEYTEYTDDIVEIIDEQIKQKEEG